MPPKKAPTVKKSRKRSNETRGKTFRYKRATIIGSEPQKLADLLAVALDQEPRPLRRRQRLGVDNDLVRLIGSPYSRGDMICGSMVDYTEGSHQPIITLDEDAIELAISLLPPREREQYLAHMLFFGVQGNHVVLMQSQGLQSGHFENHLNWLFTEKTNVLSGGAGIVLDNYLPKFTRDRVEGVTAIQLRGRLPREYIADDTEHTPKPRSIMEAIRRRLQDAAETQGMFLDRLKAADALARDDVEVVVELKRAQPSRSGTVLDELAHVLRHSDDDVFTVRTRSGTIFRGGELRLSKDVRVEVVRGGMPILFDVAAKMEKWVAELIAAEDVPVE